MADIKDIKTNDGYQPNWTHFNPSDVVFVQNPFDHEVYWDVFDAERNRQVRYKIGPNERAELTGGLVHTLGVKALVDALIQQNGNKLQMWDPVTRAKYEEQVIIKVKQSAATKARMSDDGDRLEVDVSSGRSEAKQEAKTSKKLTDSTPEFPDAKSTVNLQPPAPDLAGAVANLPDTDVIEEK